MICCQNGAQDAVLLEIADQGWRRAYSRGGFVTVKHDQTTDQLPHGVFVRTAAWTIGSVKGADGKQLIADLVTLVKSTERKFDQLHVWPRDRVPIGKFDFEPGPDELTHAIAAEVAQALAAAEVNVGEPNRIASAGQHVLDVVIVGPAEWWIGWHSVHPALAKKSAGNLLPTAWPGGVQPIEPEGDVISRAYFKAAEALAWSGFDIKPGDRCVEVGSAPGGACKRLLELGLSVVGIDPRRWINRSWSIPIFATSERAQAICHAKSFGASSGCWSTATCGPINRSQRWRTLLPAVNRPSKACY